MAVGDITEVIIGGKMHTGNWQCVMHFQTSVSIGPKEQELASLADVIEELWASRPIGTVALDLMSTGADIRFIRLRDWIDDTIGLDTLFPVPLQGTLAGDGLPAEIACMVRKHTEKIGKSFTGRNYFPFGAEPNQSSGLWDTGFVQLVVDWFLDNIDIIGDLALHLWKLQVFSKTVPTTTAVNAMSGSLLTTSQNRRMR